MEKQGTVLRWDATRGFGFLRSGDTGADVFFHVRDLRGMAEPRPGMSVVYEEIHVGGKGPRAMAVRSADRSTAAETWPQPMAQRGPPHTGRSGPRSNAPPHRAQQPSSARSQPRPQGNVAPATGALPRGAPARRASSPSPSNRQRRPARDAPSANRSVAFLWMAAWLALVAWGVWTHRMPLGWLAALAGVNLLTFVVYASDKAAARSGGWRTSEQRLHLLALLGGWPAAWWAQQWMRHKSSKASFRAVYWLTVVAHCAALAAVLLWQRGGLLRFL